METSGTAAINEIWPGLANDGDVINLATNQRWRTSPTPQFQKWLDLLQQLLEPRLTEDATQVLEMRNCGWASPDGRHGRESTGD